MTRAIGNLFRTRPPVLGIGPLVALAEDSERITGKQEVTALLPVCRLLGSCQCLRYSRECQVSYVVDIATDRQREPLAVELPKRDANRCILVRGCKPVFVLLCDAEEVLHLLRTGRCGRPVRIEWPCELAEEAVEFLLAHVN